VARDFQTLAIWLEGMLLFFGIAMKFAAKEDYALVFCRQDACQFTTSGGDPKESSQ